MHVLIDATTRQVIGYGYMPTPPADPNLTVVEITETQAAKLTQPGVKVLGANGQVTVTPPDPNTPSPLVPAPNPKHDAAITALKGAAKGKDGAAALAQAILDMQGIG
jgi:hypothetical protein